MNPVVAPHVYRSTTGVVASTLFYVFGIGYVKKCEEFLAGVV
jgi:hypothetical protein